MTKCNPEPQTSQAMNPAEMDLRRCSEKHLAALERMLRVAQARVKRAQSERRKAEQSGHAGTPAGQRRISALHDKATCALTDMIALKRAIDAVKELGICRAQKVS